MAPTQADGARVLALVIGLVMAAPGVGAQEAGRAVRGDVVLRPGYHGSWRTDRDGGSSDRHDVRMRLQLGGWWVASPAWAVRIRAAGRLSTDQETLRFYVRDGVPTTDGLRLGELTIDEAYVRWSRDDRFQLRVGRMQTSYELAGVPRKALDRNDSPNTDVTWTDGLHASFRVVGAWRQHLVLQRNGDRGPSNVVRRPLDASAPDSRVIVFTAAALEGRSGPFIQRELGLTWIPGAVPGADPVSARGDYLALVLRGAVQPALAVLGGRVVLGSELGLAFGTPSRTLLGTGIATDEGGDGFAYQLSASVMEMGGHHSIGIVHSRAGDGWLISPDIRDNNREVEARYYWHYARWGRLDVRFRSREDLVHRVDALQRRRDRDVYVRTTLRF
jgi:hypothetical protein